MTYRTLTLIMKTAIILCWFQPQVGLSGFEDPIKFDSKALGESLCFANKIDTHARLCIGRPIPNLSRTCSPDRWDSFHSAKLICENKGARLLTREEWIWLAKETTGAIYEFKSNAAGLVYINTNNMNFHLPDELGLDSRAEYWMEEANLISLKESGLIYSPYHYARCFQGLSVVCAMTTDLPEKLSRSETRSETQFNKN